MYMNIMMLQCQSAKYAYYNCARVLRECHGKNMILNQAE